MRFTRASIGLSVAFATSEVMAQTLTPAMIDAMGNNSLFDRWRPYSHFQSPAGWMNDPCGAMYDPVSKLYHLHYQFHPNHFNWGNISWGHATSPDLIHWTDVNHLPGNGLAAWQDTNANSIGTSNLTSNHHDPALYNHLGIWSGTAQSVNLKGEQDGTLLAFYTSVSRLPLSWDQPYPVGCESESYAISTDGGITWTEYAGNPVISGPPAGWNVTGFRDPYLFPSTKLDKMLKYTEPHYYVIFGSGIHGVGPRMPLFSTPASDMTDWTFLGALWEPVGGSTLGNVYETGPYGYNFEVANFFELDGSWFIGAGIQGGNTSSFHSQVWVIWNEVEISTRANGSIEVSPISGGGSDWGNLYAITSFLDTKNNRRVQWGWSYEDMNGYAAAQQGWNGAFALPRELFVKRTYGVTHSAKDKTIGSNVYTSDQNGVWTARTLGVRPLRDVVKALRAPATHTSYNPGLPIHGNNAVAKKNSNSYEVRVTLQSTTGLCGIIVAASPDGREYTTVWYNPANSSIGVDRTHSSLIRQFSTQLYQGYFKPYTFATGRNQVHSESITFDIFVDGSMVEVYVNDRFSLTSRIYPSMESSTGVGLYVGSGVTAQFGKVDVWDGLLNVWPHRPKNSSSVLVYDTPAETDNYIWWAGNK